jgi:nucleotide-binding universal stress UspA family protein
MSTPPNQQTDPEQLRREIEEIRRELGETVAQLANKADVKAQVREKADEMKAAAQRHTPDTARGGAQQVAAGARQHPAPIAIGGALLLGFLIGRRAGRRRA